MSFTLGFIGFGEAGYTIGKGLRSEGLERVVAYDIATDSGDRGPLIRERAADAGVVLAPSSEVLAGSADVILSTVTSSSALDAARQTAPFLTARHLYADLNSVSPTLKREIADVVSTTGASFVEVAVMAPVHPAAHRVPMLLAGPSADRLADALTPFGVRMKVLDGGFGTAAAVKMCRSVVVKGLEALLCECVLAASQYAAADLVFDSLNESYPGLNWNAMADYTMNRMVVHGARRAREMEEVAETLRAAGVEPTMAEATARRQDWIAKLQLNKDFAPSGPVTYGEVLAKLR